MNITVRIQNIPQHESYSPPPSLQKGKEKKLQKYGKIEEYNYVIRVILIAMKFVETTSNVQLLDSFRPYVSE